MRRRDFGSMLGGATLLGGFGHAYSAEPDLATAAREAWLYAAPLIEIASTRARMLDGSYPGQPAGLNAFGHASRLSGPRDRALTTPNNDTLYSNAFIDLTRGPVMLDVPDAGARYLSVAGMDMFTNNNFIVGARTPGGAAGRYRVLGPDMRPEHPRDLQLRTPHGWLLARVLVASPADLTAARRVQRGLKLSGATPPAPRSYPTRDASWSAYFAAAREMIGSEGPGAAPTGRAALERVRLRGATGDFALSGYTPADAEAIGRGVREARAIVEGDAGRVRLIQGWTYSQPDLGDFGDDYLYRAVIAVRGLAALPRSEATYMRAGAEAGGLSFNDDRLHRLTLPASFPVDGFWSLTMYEMTPQGQSFLTENVLNRYAIGDRTPGLMRNGNGGVDLWIGRRDPGGARTANWLPAPRSGPFSLTLRAYLPRPELQDGRYRLPPVVAA